jgi:hypothetical protein
METGATLTHNAPLCNTIPTRGLQTIRRTELLFGIAISRIRLCRAGFEVGAQSSQGLGRAGALQAALQYQGAPIAECRVRVAMDYPMLHSASRTLSPLPTRPPFVPARA